MVLQTKCPECGGELWRGKRCDNPDCEKYTNLIDEPDIDAGEIITAGELQDELAPMSDDALIAVQASGAWNWAYTTTQTETNDGAVPVLLLDEHKPLFD